MCFGGISEPVSLGRALCRAEGDVGGVRFGRGGEVEHGLGDRELALGRAEALVDVPGGERLRQRLRVGHADVLGGEADQAAGDEERVLAAGEHAREPVEGRVGVGAAQRLVQGAR